MKSDSSPLFSSGTARGGTNLTSMMLSVHPAVSLAQDPFIPLFRSYRNAVVAQTQGGKYLAGFDPNGPLDEYYYGDGRLQVMDWIQESDPNLPFDASERPRLLESLARRMSLSSPLLAPHLSHLQGKTYREIFESSLRVVEAGRGTPNASWIGFNDNWTVEFFAPLARAFPKARFLIILRDVRAAITSGRRVKDLSTIPLILSFARNWRKHVAFAHHYQEMALFRGRLGVVSYERLVADPEGTIKELCNFLGIDFLPDMLDTTKFVSPDGGTWIPNSTFNVPQKGIYQASVDQWKQSLPEDITRLVELVCGPEIEALGYSLCFPAAASDSYSAIFRRMVQDDRECIGWRTDNRDPMMDFSLELMRRFCLEGKIDDAAVIKRCFLFPEAYQNLMNKTPLCQA